MFTEKEVLKERVESKRKELEGQLKQLSADAKSSSNKAMARVEEELNTLKTTLKDGWDNFSEDMAGKLNRWLERNENRTTA